MEPRQRSDVRPPHGRVHPVHHASGPSGPGFLAGWQVLGSTLTLTSDGAVTGIARADFYDMNRQLYRSVCPTVAGERFR